MCLCCLLALNVIYVRTPMARYSLFVLKVPLNTKQTNRQCGAGSQTFLWQILSRLFYVIYDMEDSHGV